MGYLDPIDTTIGMVERVGLLEKVMLKLISSPEQARRNLVEALGEIEKSTTALRDALLSVSNIPVTSEVTSGVARQLDDLSSGTLEISVRKAMGSCHRIGNIHDTYLRGALTGFLDPDEASELSKLFDDLSRSDASFLEIAQIISGRVKEVSRNLRKLLDKGELAEAKTVVSALREESLAKAERLNAILAKMIELDAQFVKKSGLP